VPVKTPDNQASLMLVGLRDRLIRNRVQLANAIRGYAAEFGLTAAKGMCKIEPLLDRAAADETLPALARELFAFHAGEDAQLQGRLEKVEAKLMVWHRAGRMQSAPGADPGHRSDRRVDAGDEDAAARSLPIGSPLCRVARLDTERSLYGWER
jgi:transposase